VNHVTGDYSRGAAGFWVEHGDIQYPVQEVHHRRKPERHVSTTSPRSATTCWCQGSKQCGSILVENMTVAGR